MKSLPPVPFRHRFYCRSLWRAFIGWFGAGAGVDDLGLFPGRHTLQFTPRNKQVWLLLDGKPIAYAVDPRLDVKVTRIGFHGGWGGRQTLYLVRIRAK